jgi:GGDEF domain-containing protein
MVLDYSVRRLVKNQKQLKLIEKFYEINPLSQENYHGIIQRVLEIVGEFIPADNIDFFEPPADKLEKVTPPARRKLYEQCVSWVLQNEKMLKIKDLRSESLAGRRLDRFGQTDVKSLLAGPLYAGEEIVGVLLLDHHEADFFTEDEERILGLLFKQLGQILKVATHIRILKAQRSEGLQLFSLLEELSAGKDLISSAEIFVKQLVKNLSIHGAAFYWWNNQRFELVHSKGPGNPSPSVELSDTLVRRLKNSGSAGGLLNFPDVNHLDGYEAPLGVKSILTSGVFREGKLRGFIVIFKESDQKLSKRVKNILDSVQKISSERLSLLDRSDKWRQKAARDEMSSLPTFKKWKKELFECLRLNPDKLTIWHLEIPGFEEIGVRSGKKKLDSWLKSSSRLLIDNLPDAKICRAYGSVFYGFSHGSVEEVEKKLAEVCELLEKWEFPLGEWPSHPRFLSACFSPPYPGTGKIIQAPTYSYSSKEEK